ncbi:hypothetical protein ACFX2F_006048 [Malus domestica]
MLRAQSSIIGNIPINKNWSSPLFLFGPIFGPILGPPWRYNCNTFQHIQTCPHRYCGPDQAAPFAATQFEQKPDPLWHPDTGATHHMTSQSSLVAHMEPYAGPSPSNVYSADESEKFVEASKKGNLIPLSRSIFSDHLTPVLAYRCLVKEDDRDAPSFLFESVEPGSNDSNVGRHSVIGAQPSIEIVAKENMVTIMDHKEGCRTEEFVEDPMTVPRRIMEGWTPQLLDELPEAFCGGWVGYFSYDTVRFE